MKVNIGAGDKPLEGWVNVDLEDFDATKRWPYPDASLAIVNADCLLPHFPPPGPGERDPLDSFLVEAARCLHPGGELRLTAPDYRVPCEALGDVYHYRLITPRTFYHFTQEETERPLEAGGLYFELPSVKRVPLDDAAGGVPRVLSQFLRLGPWQEPILKIVARKLGLKFLLRSTHLSWTLKRNQRRYGDGDA